MRRKTLKNLILILSAILAAECIFAGFLLFTQREPEQTLSNNPVSTEAPVQNPTDVISTEEVTLPAPETTAAPTETQSAETEPTVTEPREIRYTLTFTGDCTLGSDPNDFGSQHSFVGTVGTDYGFPFRNVLSYFENDDLTLINLESVLADSNEGRANKTFNFRGPTAYTEIMTGSSVEGVTLANNHSGDFGKPGYESTVNALKNAGIHYVEENKTTLVTTDSGLVVGLYADSFYFNYAEIQQNIRKLKDQGAEIIVCAFHWGSEGSYRASGDQQSFAKAAIDAGADIVWGHHPHVLQKIEEYNGGIIYYSLGNFSFGGNNFPRDLDSAIVQQEIIRDVDGSVRLGELTIIPISITSLSAQNNFQPTPCEEGSERYNRVLSKLDGSFNGPDLVVDYSFLNPTEPPTEAPTEAPDTGSDEGEPSVTEPAGDGDDAEPPVTEPAGDGDDAEPPAGGDDNPPAEGGDDNPPAEGGDANPPAEGGDANPPAEGGGEPPAEG